MKRRFEDPEEHVRQSKVVKIALSRPEVREILENRYKDPVELERHSKLLKKRYEDPELRVKLREILKKRYEDHPELRVRQSKAMKKRYEDPEERRKTGEAIRRSLMKRKQGGGDPGNQIS